MTPRPRTAAIPSAPPPDRAPRWRRLPLLAIVAALLVAAVPAALERDPAGALTSGGWTTTATAAPSTAARGSSVTVTVRVTSSTSRRALVDLEVYGPDGARLHQRVWDRRWFSARTTREFSSTFTIPGDQPIGAHAVRVGVFGVGWGGLQHWNGAAASFSVATSTTTTTAPPATTTTAPPATTTTAPPATTTTTAPPSGSLPARPAGWPSTIELGSSDEPGGAGALRATAPFRFRSQYLAGGVNTGAGWATWNPNGGFVTSYIEESRSAGMIPVFDYYMLLQSNPGAGQGEPAGVYTNLGTASTMAAYYADLKLFFQRAGAAGGTTVLHVEPDLWAYLHQRAGADDASRVPVRVGSSGMADVAGLPDTGAGFAQAIVRLRDRYAPGVQLGYHFSTWETGDDFLYSDPSDSVVDGLGARAGRFYQSLGAPFDVAFTDIADRDAAFKQHVYGDGGASWMDADDYRRSTVYIGAFVRTARLRAVLWQLPLGNTKMRAQDNTWNHYQDNKVEWLLDEPARTHLAAYARAGVLAFVFGRGADGPTCACDANRDGVTNPAPIGGNTRTSLSADDDGGFFDERAAAYYRAGAMAAPR